MSGDFIRVGGSSGGREPTDDRREDDNIDSLPDTRAPVPDDDGRLMVYLSDDGTLLEPTGEVSKNIAAIFHRTWRRSPTWKGLSAEEKEMFWDEFQKGHRWTDPLPLVRRAFMRHAAIRFRDNVHNIKDKWFKEKKRTDTVPDEFFQEWLAHWEKDETKKIAAQASKNRLSEPSGPGTGPSTHTCGSRSMRQHERDLEKREGKKPSAHKLFLYTHTKRHDEKTFVDKRSQTINEAFSSQRPSSQLADSATSGADSNAPDLSTDADDAFFIELATEKKKRVYGLGGSSYASKGKSISGSYSQSTGSQQFFATQEDFDQAVRRSQEELRRTVREEVTADVEAQVEARVQRLHEQMQRDLEQRLQEQMRHMEERFSIQQALRKSTRRQQQPPPRPDDPQ